MKKYFFSTAFAVISFISYGNDLQKKGVDNPVLKKFVKSQAENSIAVGNCVGDIIIFDSRGNVKNRIQFSAPQATSLQDCIGLYHLAVYKVTLNLGQGETTGGTISF